MAVAQAGKNCRRWSRRLEDDRRTTIAILRPLKIWWWRRFESTVTNTSKSASARAQEFAVLLARPARFLNGTAYVALLYQVLLERSRRALINQNPHFSCAIRLSLASSIAVTASSRLTLGYSSRNWSSVY